MVPPRSRLPVESAVHCPGTAHGLHWAGRLIELAGLGRLSAAADILPHGARLLLELAEPMLDHIADADDAAERACRIHHRNVADPALGHDRHELADCVPCLAGDHTLGHHRAHTLFHHASTTFGDGPGDAAVRDDPGDPPSILGHDQSANPFGAEPPYRLADRGIRLDRADLPALAGQDPIDLHPAASPKHRRLVLCWAGAAG